jgi:hypothetical protein
MKVKHPQTTVHSKSADSAEAFKVDLIKRCTSGLHPSVEFKRMLEVVHFERSREQLANDNVN